MMQVFWTRHAKRRRREIFVHIAADNLNAAIVLDSKFQSLSVRLPQFPNSGRQGRVYGTREIVIHPQYIAVYRIFEGRIEILTIHHAARDYSAVVYP